MTDILNPPILDPRNERQLTQEAKLSAFQRSQGVINSTNEGDPLDVLVRTQAYAAAELLFYANQTPLAFAIKFLELTGTVRRLGTKARATLTFRLTAPRSTPFFVAAGFEVTGSDRSGTYSFFTITDLTIPIGEVTGTVIAEAEAVGSAYNLTRGAIKGISQPIAFLQSVINLEPAQGGTEPESVESAVQRGVAALRRKSPISANDYEEEAEGVLGGNSRAIAIGLLAADRATEEKGAVHLFLLSSTGAPANEAEISAVRAAIGSRIQLGTRLYISPIQTINVRSKVIARIATEANPEDVADNLWQVFQEALDPAQYPTGEAVNPFELSHQFRFAGGVEFIEFVALNDEDLPIAMPNDFTLPIARGILCELTDENGIVYQIIRGWLDFDEV